MGSFLRDVTKGGDGDFLPGGLYWRHRGIYSIAWVEGGWMGGSGEDNYRGGNPSSAGIL